MLIRWATENDLPAWYELATEVSQIFQHPADMGAELKSKTSGLGTIGRQEMLTAIDNSGKNMGFICFSRTDNSITWFAVSEKYRGEGVGDRLLKTALLQLNITKDIAVITFPADYPQGAAVRALYKKYGFSIEKPCTHDGLPRSEMKRPASNDLIALGEAMQKKPYVIIVAGIPASGKTTYANHISAKLKIPFIGKDAIKEKLYDVIKFDTSKRENSQLYGGASYSVFFHIAECLMKANVSCVLESNFIPSSADILLSLVSEYNYAPLTILFDAEIKTLHKRFFERDATDERHPGLASTSNVFDDLEYFKNATLPLRDFCVGDKVAVDTTDFSTVGYEKIDNHVINFIRRVI